MGDLREDLERIGQRVEPEADAFARLERRRRARERNRRFAAGGLALVLAIGGSVVAYSVLRDDDPAGIVVGASGPVGDDLAPDVARVTCDGTSTVVEPQVVQMDPQTGEILETSSAVRAQGDGVHVIVTNTSGGDLSFQWDLGGENAPIGKHELVLTLPPGVTGVRCQDPGEDAGPPGAYVDLEIVDPDGVYVSTELSCDEVTGWFADYGPDATGDPDPVQSARDHLHGLEPGDVVEAAGYPEDETPQVRVVRDRQVIAVLEYFPDGKGGWLESTGNACSGLGIG
jgi:hypothetical protein